MRMRTPKQTPAQAPRGATATAKLTHAELALIEAAAAAMNMTRSAAMREMLVAAARQQLALDDPAA